MAPYQTSIIPKIKKAREHGGPRIGVLALPPPLSPSPSHMRGGAGVGRRPLAGRWRGRRTPLSASSTPPPRGPHPPSGALPPPAVCTVGHPSPLCTVIRRTPQPPGQTPCVTESRETYPRTSWSVTSPIQEASNVSPAINAPPHQHTPPRNFKTPKRSTVPEFHRFLEIHRRRSKRSNQHRASTAIANNEDSRKAGPRPPRTPPTLSRPIDGCDVRRIGPRGKGRGWGGGSGQEAAGEVPLVRYELEPVPVRRGQRPSGGGMTRMPRNRSTPWGEGGGQAPPPTGKGVQR